MKCKLLQPEGQFICKDIQNSPLEAGVVFKHYIMCLKNILFKRVQRVGHLSDDEIEYILTAPNILGHKAKLFMTNAAVNVSLFKTFVLFLILL